MIEDPSSSPKKKQRNFKQLIFPPLDSTVLLGRVTEVGEHLLKTHNIPEVPASLSQISLLTPEGRTKQLMMMVTRELRSNVIGNHQNSSPERVQPEHLVAAVKTVQMEIFEKVWQSPRKKKKSYGFHKKVHRNHKQPVRRSWFR